MSADPSLNSAGVLSPGSWNRYSYTRNDPVNRVDPRGLADWEVTVTADPYDGCEEDSRANGCIETAPVNGGGTPPGGTGGPVMYDENQDRLFGPYNQGNKTKITGNSQARASLRSEIDNLSGNCLTQLGGASSLQKTADNLDFWDARIYGPVSASTVIPGTFSQSFSQAVGDQFAVTLQFQNGTTSPDVVLGSAFFSADAGRQGLTLLHELLHYGFQGGDVAVAGALNITSFYGGESASKAISDWLSNDCKNGKY